MGRASATVVEGETSCVPFPTNPIKADRKTTMQATIQGIASFTITEGAQRCFGVIGPDPITGHPRLSLVFDPDLETPNAYVASADYTGGDLLECLVRMAKAEFVRQEGEMNLRSVNRAVTTKA